MHFIDDETAYSGVAVGVVAMVVNLKLFNCRGTCVTYHHKGFRYKLLSNVKYEKKMQNSEHTSPVSSLCLILNLKIRKH